ncbi:VOC family protein, partial [Mycobacterium sp.]|uniref:VOC family protein n=1 Tax=Mycobacterium sp. TaxID=1785 RepID=UPI003F9463BE
MTAGRFLHVNLNVDSADAAADFYGRIIGMRAVMQTDPDVPADGSIFGMDQRIFTDTRFLYDARGGRGGCALEVIEWRSPVLVRDPGGGPDRPGLSAAWFAVADLEAAAAALQNAGVPVGRPVDGLVSGQKAILASDHDGVVVELTQASGTDAPLLSGIRLSVSDADPAIRFLTAIGFSVVEPLHTESVAGDQLLPGGGAVAVDCQLARLALAEDGHQFTVLLVEHPGGAPQRAPGGASSQGLYRCALRVDNVAAALARLPDFVDVT